jgi:hypothetical protein
MKTLLLLPFLALLSLPACGRRTTYGTSDRAGLFVVRIGDKEGYIDRSGKVAIAPQFDHAMPFSEGLAAVNIGGKLGGSWFANISGGKWGYIDRSGSYIVKPQFDEAWPFSGGRAAVRIGNQETGKWGFVDRSDKLVIAPQFRVASWFSEGLALVATYSVDGYIDTTGKYVIRAKFDDAEPFFGTLARVTIDGKEAYIDKTGKPVWESSEKGNPTFTPLEYLLLR